MILYSVYDKKNGTFSYPLTAESKQQVEESLAVMNPENLEDLHVEVICPLSANADIFLLSVHPEKKYPAFLANRSAEVTSSATQQAKRASATSPKPRSKYGKAKRN